MRFVVVLGLRFFIYTVFYDRNNSQDLISWKVACEAVIRVCVRTPVCVNSVLYQAERNSV